MSTPVPAPRSGGELKKPIPAPRTKIMLARQKSDESSSSKSSEENVKSLSKTARRVRSFSYASKQIAGDIGGIVQNKFESTRQSVRRLTRTFSISSHPEESESEVSKNEDNIDENLDIFNSIKFDSPISAPKKQPEYTNWEPPRKKAEEVLSEHLFSLPPPSYPPPSLPDDSLYNEPPAVPSPVCTVPRKSIQRGQSNADIYESVYPLKLNSEKNHDSEDNASVITENTSLTIESNSELSHSSSWKFYDSVLGNLKEEIEQDLKLLKPEESKQENDIDANSNFSVEVKNSIYENCVIPNTPSRPSQSVIFQFDPLLNTGATNIEDATKIEDYKMLEEILQEDLYGNISTHRTIDSWSISDSEAEEFQNPPSPPVRFDSLLEEPSTPTVKEEKLRPAPVPPSANNSTKNSGGERRSWLKHVKDVVIASSDIIKGKHKDGVTQRPMVHMKNSAYKKGMLYKVQNGPVEDLFGEYSGRWCILENGNMICYSNNSCEHIKEHFPVDTILSVEYVKHPRLKLKSDNYELHCFKLNASGKSRGSHVYGSRNASDRRLWMQNIGESLTTRFGTKLTSDFIRMGWVYVREGVTGKWMGAWLILGNNRILQYAIDGQPVRTIDLRKARCIALQTYEDTDQNPQTSDKGPNMLVDACNVVVYMRMWTTRETKIWCHLIKVAAHTNGAGLEEQQLTKNDVPVIVEKCINFIYLTGSMTKGIYRQSGVGSLISELLTKFAEDAWAVQITNDKFSEHDVATALKRFFRDLPEPLMGVTHRQYFYQVSLIKNDDDKIRMYKAALDNLPSIAYKTARKLLGHLHFVSTQSTKNLMNIVNLAAIWGPTLMHFKNDNGTPQPPGAHQMDIMVVADLISLYKQIFPEDALELEQERVMLQVLEKHIQSPQGAVSKHAGDLRLWIYLGDKDGETFNVAIGPNKTALEVCSELSAKVKLQVYEMILEEVVLGGQLTRPIHHSEKILEIVLKWGYWDDADRKDNYIVISNLSKYSDYLQSKVLLISGDMKFADSKTKSCKNFTFDFSRGQLSCYKDKACDIKVSSWNLEDICWYWGHEIKRNPQTKWTITFFPKEEVHKRSKNQPFFGNIIVWSDSQARANWLSIMLKHLYPDGITQPLHNIRTYSRVGLQLFIGLLVLLGNYGQEWEVAMIKTKTPYKAGNGIEIEASLGVHIGLRSVNVTLKANTPPNSTLQKEIIDYNERFTWTWDQGTFGFGPHAGRLQQEFRAAQLRGVPTPILWIVEYFVIDGEGFRHGRFYRTSGWYCHVLMWSAFATWLLSVILFRSVIVYGGYCLGLTGILQLVANLVWLVVKNPLPLFIPFEDDNLVTSFGATYWLTFFNGLLCLLLAIVIVVIDQIYVDQLYSYFEIDPLSSFDEISYLTPEEESLLRHKEKKNDIPLVPMTPPEEEDEKVDYIPVYKRRGTVRYRQVPPIPPAISRSNKPRRLMEVV